MTMIERVAREIVLNLEGTLLPKYPDESTRDVVCRKLFPVARAAIGAMREPTEEMQLAGGDIGQWAEGMPQPKEVELAWRSSAAAEVYSAMIDAALAKP